MRMNNVGKCVLWSWLADGWLTNWPRVKINGGLHYNFQGQTCRGKWKMPPNVNDAVNHKSSAIQALWKNG